jgi:hypothetical protein
MILSTLFDYRNPQILSDWELHVQPASAKDFQILQLSKLPLFGVQLKLLLFSEPPNHEPKNESPKGQPIITFMQLSWHAIQYYDQSNL